jgi:hypothetical protein
VAGWALFVLFFISQDTGRRLYQGETVQWHGYLVVWLTTAFAWAGLAPFLWWLANRFPVEPKSWWCSGGLHLDLASSFSFAVIEAALFAGITPRFGMP